MRCVDFQYFCVEIVRDDDPPTVASVDFSVQGVDITAPDGVPVRDDNVLIDCQKMECVGKFQA